MFALRKSPIAFPHKHRAREFWRSRLCLRPIPLPVHAITFKESTLTLKLSHYLRAAAENVAVLAQFVFWIDFLERLNLAGLFDHRPVEGRVSFSTNSGRFAFLLSSCLNTANANDSALSWRFPGAATPCLHSRRRVMRSAAFFTIEAFGKPRTARVD